MIKDEAKMKAEYLRLIEAQNRVLLSANEFKAGVDALVGNVKSSVSVEYAMDSHRVGMRIRQMVRDTLVENLIAIKDMRQSGAAFYDVVSSASLVSRLSTAINDLGQHDNGKLNKLTDNQAYQAMCQSMQVIAEHIKQLKADNLNRQPQSVVVEVDFSR